MNKKLALNSRSQTYQILTNDDEVCIPNFKANFLFFGVYMAWFFI